jgi:hypothetical protein
MPYPWEANHGVMAEWELASTIVETVRLVQERVVFTVTVAPITVLSSPNVPLRPLVMPTSSSATIEAANSAL